MSINHTQSRYRYFIGIVLSFLMPVLGMLYLGRPIRAVVYAIIMAIAWFTGFLMHLDQYWMHGMLLNPVVLLTHAYAAFDSARILSQADNLNQRQRVKWLVVTATSGILLIVMMYQWQAQVMVFNIASASMAPNLIHGDKVLALTTSPASIHQRGEIVIFKHPTENEYQVKRIVGVAKDWITYSNQVVRINDVPIRTKRAETKWSSREQLRWLSAPVYVEEYQQARYQVMVQDESYGPIGEMTVQPEHYFLLGDNRNMSIDSRMFGSINEKSIIAKPMLIFFSSIKMKDWLIRWNRIGFLQ